MPLSRDTYQGSATQGTSDTAIGKNIRGISVRIKHQANHIDKEGQGYRTASRKESLTSLGNGSSYLMQQLDLTSYRRCGASVVYDPLVATERIY
jgi:hypothetical protein